MYYPYRVFITGDRSFNNYFLYSYYLNGYTNDKTVLYSARPSHIDNMTEVFATSKNVIHLSCDAERVIQQSGKEMLYQKIAQAANFAIITHSSSDFVIDFARVLPGVPKAQVRSRVILAPEHAKRLLGALQENIFRYEREFGTIKIPNQEGRTVAPFDIPKGEA